MLKKKGFTNVKLYQAGEPEWKKKDYLEVGTTAVASAYKKGSAVIIDARPYKKYLGETIPSSMSIDESNLEELKGRFPVDKTTKIITFCGGYGCAKSHNVAKALVKSGYTKVAVYAAGIPAWKKAGNATTASKSTKTKKDTKAKEPKFLNGIMLGADEGTVDGDWYKANFKKLDKIAIIDVRSKDVFAKGSLPGSINIPQEDFKAKDFVAKLPKGKTIVFNCAAGVMSIDAYNKAKKGGADMAKVYYFDANIECKGNECTIEVNEPLD